MSLEYKDDIKGEVKRVKLSKETINLIGRAEEELDIYLFQTSEDLSYHLRKIELGVADITVSRYSPNISKFGTAMLKYEPKSKKFFLATSPNSTNKVKLNGEDVDVYEWKELKNRDSIKIGFTIFTFLEEE